MPTTKFIRRIIRAGMILLVLTIGSLTALGFQIAWQKMKSVPESSALVLENKAPEAASLQPESEEEEFFGEATEERVIRETPTSRVPPPLTDPLEVEQAAKKASKLTGVRQEFLMGVLTVESQLGQNVGQCTYRQVSDGAEAAHRSGRLSSRAWNTFLTRQEQIRGIASDLGYDLEKLKVSCNPNPAQYMGTGGAMGLPQFMPSTWIEYKERLAALSGKEHPDPWDVYDGVLAMALKLSDVPGVTEHNVTAEKQASKLYLSGSISQKYQWYANDIQYWAVNHPALLGDLTTMSLLLNF